MSPNGACAEYSRFNKLSIDAYIRGTTRLFKEHRSYVLEEEQQKIKVDKFVADGAEDWDIKNGVRATSWASVGHPG